jgi:hypothetical protein
MYAVQQQELVAEVRERAGNGAARPELNRLDRQVSQAGVAS